MRGRGDRGRGGGSCLKALLGSIALLVLFGFLFVRILANRRTSDVAVAAAASASTSTGIRSNYFKHFKAMGREAPIFRKELDPNYMSKRRVPNGPDPIHNRGAGRTRQPPGQSYP